MLEEYATRVEALVVVECITATWQQHRFCM